MTGLAAILARELRATARRPWTWWLRVGAAGAVLLLFTLVLWDPQVRQGQTGARLFLAVHAAFLATIYLLAPALAADGLSRERREGTLPLLFLTPLDPLSLVVGKLAAHAIRAASVLAATIPVLTLPFLLGGLDTLDLLTALSFQVAALALALSASVLASALARRRARATLLACAGTALAALLQGALALGLAVCVTLPDDPDALIDLWRDPFEALATALRLLSGAFDEGTWQQMLTSPSTTRALRPAWPLVIGVALLVSLLISLQLLRWAARRLDRCWREEAPSARRHRLVRTFTTPIVSRAFMRRHSTRLLRRNPIGWLQQRTWSARAAKWGWAVGFLLVEIMVLRNLSAWTDAQDLLHAALYLALAFAVAGSFHTERENGVLELLLVAPLRVRLIIWGRLRGVWSQFLPSLLILLLSLACVHVLRRQLDLSGPWHAAPSTGLSLVELLGTFLAQPLVGLYFSLRGRSYLNALLWLLGTYWAVPIVLLIGYGFLGETRLFGWLPRTDTLSDGLVVGLALTYQGLLAVMCGGLLDRALTRRSFRSRFRTAWAGPNSLGSPVA